MKRLTMYYGDCEEAYLSCERCEKAIGKKPLFGHHSGKQSRTFWACFMKLEEMEMLEGLEDGKGNLRGL